MRDNLSLRIFFVGIGLTMAVSALYILGGVFLLRVIGGIALLLLGVAGIIVGLVE